MLHAKLLRCWRCARKKQSLIRFVTSCNTYIFAGIVLLVRRILGEYGTIEDVSWLVSVSKRSQIQFHKKAWRNIQCHMMTRMSHPMGKLVVSWQWHWWHDTHSKDRSACSLVGLSKTIHIHRCESVVLMKSDWLDQLKEVLEFWKSRFEVGKFKRVSNTVAEKNRLYLSDWQCIVTASVAWLFLCDTTCVNSVGSWQNWLKCRSDCDCLFDTALLVSIVLSFQWFLCEACLSQLWSWFNCETGVVWGGAVWRGDPDSKLQTKPGTAGWPPATLDSQTPSTPRPLPPWHPKTSSNHPHWTPCSTGRLRFFVLQTQTPLCDNLRG